MSHCLDVPLSLPQAIIAQLVDGLSEIHSKGVFHKDIKPDNILVQTRPDGPRVKIIDLGSGAELKEGMYTTPQGRASWFQPCSLSRCSVSAGSAPRRRLRV